MANASNPDMECASTGGLYNEYVSCPENYAIIYFYLEASGRSHKISQIAAKYDEVEFNIYVTPTILSPEASNVNGSEVLSVPLLVALEKFRDFLVSSRRRNILVAHNWPFDGSLIHAFDKTNSTESFSDHIHGIVNTLPLFREMFPEYEKHSLEHLALCHLNDISLDNFPNGIYDVVVLQLLVEKFIPEAELIQRCKPYDQLVQRNRELEQIRSVEQTLQPLKNVISDGMIRKLAEFNLDYETLVRLYRDDGIDAVVNKLWGGPENSSIIKRKEIITSILGHLQEETREVNK